MVNLIILTIYVFIIQLKCNLDLDNSKFKLILLYIFEIPNYDSSKELVAELIRSILESQGH